MRKKKTQTTKTVALSETNVRVGTYTRRSTDDENQPYSIDLQDTRLDPYIVSQPGWHKAKSFTDDASGATIDRDGLQQALAAARAGLIDVLLVYRVDRFSRKLSDLVYLLDELDKCGVVFRSATEPFDTSTPIGRMLVQMLGMFAQFERDTIIDRVVGGMERKAAQGKWAVGPRPYGYIKDQDTHRLTPNETEAALIQSIFHMYTRQRLGSRVIANTLNEHGHRTRSGKPWSHKNVLYHLSNRTHLGEINFRDITAESAHPAIVDTATWEQAQAIMEERGESLSHRDLSTSDYILTKKMRCPKCGKAMLGTRANGRSKTYRYYTCYSLAHYGKARCDAERLDADKAEKAILESLADFYSNQHNLIQQAITEEQHQHTASHRDRITELAVIESELAKTTTAIDRNLTAFENGTLDEETIGPRIKDLRDTQRQLITRRDHLTQEISNPPAMPEPAELHSIADHIKTVIMAGDSQRTKNLIEALVHEVTITSPTELTPTYRVPQYPENEETAPAEAGAAYISERSAVRTPSPVVVLAGFEPATSRV